jgi:hypothetical protein
MARDATQIGAPLSHRVGGPGQGSAGPSLPSGMSLPLPGSRTGTPGLVPTACAEGVPPPSSSPDPEPLDRTDLLPVAPAMRRELVHQACPFADALPGSQIASRDGSC